MSFAYPSFENCYSDEVVEAFRARVMTLLQVDLSAAWDLGSSLKYLPPSFFSFAFLPVQTFQPVLTTTAIASRQVVLPDHFETHWLAESVEEAFGPSVRYHGVVPELFWAEPSYQSPIGAMARVVKIAVRWKRLRLLRALLRIAGGFFGAAKVDGRNAP